MYNLWPGLIRHLPGEHRAFAKRLESVKQFILKKVKEHQKSLDLSNPQDYTDCFLSKMEQVLYLIIPWECMRAQSPHVGIS